MSHPFRRTFLKAMEERISGPYTGPGGRGTWRDAIGIQAQTIAAFVKGTRSGYVATRLPD